MPAGTAILTDFFTQIKDMEIWPTEVLNLLTFAIYLKVKLNFWQYKDVAIVPREKIYKNLSLEEH